MNKKIFISILFLCEFSFFLNAYKNDTESNEQLECDIKSKDVVDLIGDLRTIYLKDGSEKSIKENIRTILEDSRYKCFKADVLNSIIDNFKNLEKELREKLKSMQGLFEAIRENSVDEVSRILKIRRDVINEKNLSGDTPLIVAIKNKNEGVVRKLLHNGADPTIIDIRGFNTMDLAKGNQNIIDPLKRALFKKLKNAFLYKNKEEVKKLLKCGLGINMQDKNGDTPLIKAIQFLQFDIAKDLIEAGANVNYVNKKGNTALIELVKRFVPNYSLFISDLKRNPYETLLALLLKKNANIDHRNNKDKNALDIAREKKFEALYRFLSVIRNRKKKFLEKKK